jgi:hypothetical protein
LVRWQTRFWIEQCPNRGNDLFGRVLFCSMFEAKFRIRQGIRS